MEQIWLVAKLTYKEGVRYRLLLGIFLVALLLSVFNLVFTPMFSFDVSKVSVDLGLSTVSMAGLSVIFFMGINLMSHDVDKRTIYMVLARPIARWQYVLGRFTGLALMVGSLVGILGLLIAAGVKTSMLMAPDHIPVNFTWKIFGISFLFSYLSLLNIAALAQLFSSLFFSSYIVFLVTGGSYFIGQNVEYIRKTFLSHNEANRFYGYLIETVTWLFPNLQAFDLKTAAGYGLPIEPLSLVWTFLYGVSYIGVILWLTVLSFQHRDLS